MTDPDPVTSEDYPGQKEGVNEPLSLYAADIRGGAAAAKGRFGSTGGFGAKKHEIDRSNLFLVAFVQDDASKAVLQAKVLELK